LRHAVPFVLAAALLAGCTSAPKGPGSTNLIDGSYQGRESLEMANAPSCPESAYGQLEVGDQALHYAYTPAIVFEASIQPDGTLHDEVGPAILDGKVAENRLAFTVTTPDCKSSYNNKFIWNHS
jgi:hypothetical protein